MDERLYPFQLEGVRFLHQAGGRAILGDEMGLGKTVQALAYADQFLPESRWYIAAPANVIHKWEREVREWTERKDPKVLTGYTTRFPKTDTIISSYNVMTKRYKEIRSWLRGSSDPALVIWDEAHYLKGNRKKVKRVAASLRLKSPHVLFLSGTPFLNRPIELFNLLDMAQPGKWNLGSYGNRYCGGFDYWKGPLKGATNLSELRSKLKSVMIRRLKRDVLDDLPTMSRIVLPVSVPTVKYRESIRTLTDANALVRIMDSWHILGQEKARVAVEWVHDFFDQHEDNKKIVLYAHHLDVIDYLKEGLREYGVFSIDGRVPAVQRDKLVNGFQKGSRPRVAIINKAGGEGIDLFGKGDVDSSTLLFVERQWSPTLEWQAEGRLDRIGQTLPVTAYYLAALDTFDTRMAQAIEEKQRIMDAVYELEDIEVTHEVVSSVLGGLDKS